MSSTEAKAWERGSFSSHQRFHAFSHLRDLPQAERSTVRAYNEHRIKCLGQKPAATVSGRWKLWSTTDNWAGRLEAWDSEVDRQRREKFMKAQNDAIERHQRLIAAAQSALFVPIRAVLDRMSSPEFVAALETQTPTWLVRDSMRAIQILPSLIAAERAALGLSQVEIAIDDRRDHHAWANRIASDPKAVHLAVELLNQIAQPAFSATDS